MRGRLKTWYKVDYTVYTDTAWQIVSEYFESIRKANKFLKEHLDGRLEIITR